MEESIERQLDDDRRLAELAAKLTDKQRKAVEIWKLGHVKPTQAMREAGYSETIIETRGAGYLFSRPAVMEYATALADTKVEAIVGIVRGQFLRLEFSLATAIDTLTHLAGHAKDESVRVRAASKLLEVGKGIMLASMPERQSDFSVAMKQIYEEALKRRLAKGEYLEMEKAEDADPEE